MVSVRPVEGLNTLKRVHARKKETMPKKSRETTQAVFANRLLLHVRQYGVKAGFNQQAIIIYLLF